MDRGPQQRTPILDPRVRRPIAWFSPKGLYLWSRFSHIEIFVAWEELWKMQEALQQSTPDTESVAMVVLRKPRERE